MELPVWTWTASTVTHSLKLGSFVQSYRDMEALDLLSCHPRDEGLHHVISSFRNEENCAKMSAPIPAGINVTFPNAAPEKSLATITAGCPVMLPCCSVPTDGTQTVDTTVAGIHTCGLGGRTVC